MQKLATAALKFRHRGLKVERKDLEARQSRSNFERRDLAALQIAARMAAHTKPGHKGCWNEQEGHNHRHMVVRMKAGHMVVASSPSALGTGCSPAR